MKEKGYFLMGDGVTKSTDPEIVGMKRKDTLQQMKPQKRTSKQNQQDAAQKKDSIFKSIAPSDLAKTAQKKKSSQGQVESDDIVDVERN